MSSTGTHRNLSAVSHVGGRQGGGDTGCVVRTGAAVDRAEVDTTAELDTAELVTAELDTAELVKSPTCRVCLSGVHDCGDDDDTAAEEAAEHAQHRARGGGGRHGLCRPNGGGTGGVVRTEATPVVSSGRG